MSVKYKFGEIALEIAVAVMQGPQVVHELGDKVVIKVSLIHLMNFFSVKTFQQIFVQIVETHQRCLSVIETSLTGKLCLIDDP